MFNIKIGWNKLLEMNPTIFVNNMIFSTTRTSQTLPLNIVKLQDIIIHACFQIENKQMLLALVSQIRSRK